MAGYNSQIHDPIDDLISDCEEGRKKLSIPQLQRLLQVAEEIKQRGLSDPENKNGFFGSILECNQAQCNIVQIIRIEALILEAGGKDSTKHVLGYFNKEAKDTTAKQIIENEPSLKQSLRKRKLR